MNKRGYEIKSLSNLNSYFGDLNKYRGVCLPDYPEHNKRYLMQCFYNLQEKYDRGQKDFTEEMYKKLENFVFGIDF